MCGLGTLVNLNDGHMALQCIKMLFKKLEQTKWAGAAFTILLIAAFFSVIILTRKLENLPDVIHSNRKKPYETFTIDSTDISSNITVLILVPSKMTNIQSREWMRRTFRQYWPEERVFKATMVFFVGRFLPDNVQQVSADMTQRDVQQEARVKRDIVQTGQWPVLYFTDGNTTSCFFPNTFLEQSLYTFSYARPNCARSAVPDQTKPFSNQIFVSCVRFVQNGAKWWR